MTSTSLDFKIIIAIVICAIIVVIGFAVIQAKTKSTTIGVTNSKTNSYISETGLRKIITGTNGSVHAIILGDSISESDGRTTKSYQAPRWNDLVTQNLSKKYPGLITWDLKSKGGTNIDYDLQRVTELDSTVDVIFICDGRNDVNENLDYFKSKYNELIKQIKTRSPKADIFLLTEPAQINNDDSKYNSIRDSILAVAKGSKVNVIDIWAAFPHDNENLRPLLVDNTHPNDKGYVLLAKTVFTSLDNFLSRH